MVSLVLTWWALGSQAFAVSAAESLLASGRLAESATAAQAAARAAPDDIEVQVEWIDSMHFTGRTQEAVSVFAKRAELNPTDANGWALLGRASQGAAASRTAYERALRIDPEHALAHLGMAAVHLVAGHITEARDAYAVATTYDVGLGEAWSGLVRTSLTLGDRPGALAAARKGMAAVPEDPTLVLWVAELDPDSADKILREGVARIPWAPRLSARLSEERLSLGDAAGARTFAASALALDPTLTAAIAVLSPADEIVTGRLDFAAWERLATARERLKDDPKGARAEFDAVVVAWPRSVLALLGRSVCGTTLGDSVSAEADLRSAASLAPADGEVSGALGLLLLNLGRTAEAIRPLDVARSARPWDAGLWYASGMARARAGDVAGGLSILAQAENDFPRDARLWTAHVDLLLTAGRTEEATAVARAGLMHVSDPKLAAMYVAAAARSGRTADAAALLEQLASQSGSKVLADLAAKLRATPPR